MIDCLDYGDYDSTRLVDYAEKIGNTGVIRRLGFIDDHYDLDIDVPILDGSIRNFLLLDPVMPYIVKKNGKWKLVVNLSDRELEDI